MAVIGAAAAAIAGWLLSGRINAVLGALLRAFNAGFEKLTGAYARIVGGLLRVSLLVLAVYGGLVVLTFVSFAEAPKCLMPPRGPWQSSMTQNARCATSAR